jgi:hypothetical protein
MKEFVMTAMPAYQKQPNSHGGKQKRRRRN